MVQKDKPAGRWSELDSKRQGLLDRCEKLASLTIPKTCLPDNFDPDSDELQFDYQSVGAQAVNNIVSKLILAMFAPSRPFVRLEPTTAFLQEVVEGGIPEEALRTVLANTEGQMVREIDKRRLRPRLYEIMRHLVVTGNALLERDDESPRVYGLRNYVARRDSRGNVAEVLIREAMQFQDLEDAVQDSLPKSARVQYQPDTKVHLFRWLKRKGDRMLLTQYVDDNLLPEEFNGSWKRGEEPFLVLVWDLATGAHYGTGLAEDYGGALGALSVLSEAQLNSAILASEYRWLANPAGNTNPEDFRNSVSGDVIPGSPDDLQLIQSTRGGELQAIGAIYQDYVNQLGRGFLLTNSVIRQAERVTAEEVRRQVTELETSLGGIYARLASELQTPVAVWLLNSIGAQFQGKDIDVVVVTGLDSLSRSGDLDNIRGWLGDLAGMAQLPETVQMRIDIEAIALRFAQGWGVDPKGLIKPAEQVQQEQQAAQAAAVAEQNAVAQGQAQAQAQNQPQEQP